MSALPDLERSFVNCELGIDAEHVCVTHIHNDGLQLLHNSMQNDTDLDDITTNSESSSTTFPPNIEYSSSSTDDDTDGDIDGDIDIVPKRTQKLRRLKKNKEALINRNKRNNPNPFSKTHKAPTTEQYNQKYKECPWEHINIPRARISYAGSVAIYYTLFQYTLYIQPEGLSTMIFLLCHISFCIGIPFRIYNVIFIR